MSYRCIRCKHVVDFQPSGQVLSCPDCGARYPLAGGHIPVFVDREHGDANFYSSQFKEQAAAYAARPDVDTARGRSVLERLLAYEPRLARAGGGTVLEIGAGSGQLTRALAAGSLLPYGELYVSDLSPEMLDVNWRLRDPGEAGRPAHYAAFNVLDMPFPDCMFDLVIGLEVLHHVLDYPLGLREIRRVLKPGGACAVMEPCREAFRIFCFLIRALVRHPLALTRGDRRRVMVWQEHFFNLMRLEDVGDHARLAHLDDKYYFDRGAMRRHAREAGFADFSECNTEVAQGQFAGAPYESYGHMAYNFFRGLGVSKWGLRAVRRLTADLDATAGDDLMRGYPPNTFLLFWNGADAQSVREPQRDER